MKSLKFAALFGALSLVFMGCPYESKVPVDDPSAMKPDNSLVGKWTDKSDDSYTYTVSIEGRNYRIEKQGKDGDPTIYMGFLSDIGGTTFLNVYEKPSSDDGSTPKYWIYRLQKKNEFRVQLDGMTENVTEEFETSAELKNFIKSNMGNSYFWDKDEKKDFLKE